MNSENIKQDVVIVGGGPAGLSAAVWCADLGLSVILAEKSSDIGGQLHSIYGPIENYLGVSAGDGSGMLSYFRQSSDRFTFQRRMNYEATSVDAAGRRVTFSNGEWVPFGALIIATGVRRRRLGVPGETEFRGKGVIESGARDKAKLSGKRVLIVGGGDAAVENALMISEHATSVTLVHRRQQLTARQKFLVELEKRKNVTTMFDTIVTRIVGNAGLSGVELRNVVTGDVWAVEADAILIRVGVAPNSEWVQDLVAVDRRGYIKVSTRCETNVDTIFAIGDVANPVSPTISTASGSGATAAKAVFELLTSSST